jgi:glucose/arabinose dehydrogenase
MRLIIFFGGCAFFLRAGAISAGTPEEPGFVDAFVENGLEDPTSIAWAPDGSNRLFVTLKSGTVRVVRDGVVQPVPFAKFSRIHTMRECGLIGLCFDPDYLTNRWVYFFVTVSRSEQQIVRFTDVDSIGASRKVVVAHLPTGGGIHNGGAIGFGHDGKLYWAIGDNGMKRGVDADLRTLASKVGRANSDGSAPVDNPFFFGGAGKAKQFIWATGFRNPFSLVFQPRTGALWLNVVGSDPEGQTRPNSGPGYEQIFVVRPGDDAGYDDFEGNQPEGVRYQTPIVRALAHPVIQYKTGRSNAGRGRAIQSVEFDAVEGAARVVTIEAHPYRAGEAVTISGNSGFDGAHVVRRVVSATELFVTNPPTDLVANGGTIEPLDQGSCVLGGSFYEASGFPEPFRGNFFYADYAGGVIMRVRLDEMNRPAAIGRFIVNVRSPVDTAVGPDGALYYAEYATGSIRKVAWQNAAQALIVAPAFLSLIEGARGGFSVRLRNAPETEMLITIQRVGGATNLAIESGETLRFTRQNWDEPQRVTIVAGVDDDLNDDTAEFTVTASGLAPENVHVSITDMSADFPVVSPSAFEIREGEVGSFEVSLPRPPPRPITVSVRSTNLRNIEVVSGGALIFTPENYSRPRTVRIRARRDGNREEEVARVKIQARGYALREVIVKSREQ